MSPTSALVLADLRGGRNGADPPLSLPENQAVEMLNVDNYTGLLGNKRGGATAVSDTGGTAFTGGIQSLFRFVPGSDETAAEFWGIDGAATPIVKRMAGGTSFADVTLSDAIATKPQDVMAATLNGKLFLAYDSTVDRLHCYDPGLASPRVRRVSFATPAAPTGANTGAGSYAATLRYYRVRWIQKTGSVVTRLSKEGASLSFTPSGTGTGVVVTQPAVASEQETHWRVEVSLDASSWYILSDVAIATTTYTDSAATTTYSSNTLSASTGAYESWTSVKYLLADGNRLLGAGGWESGTKTSRIWFSPVLGSTDEGDDERVPNITAVQQNWVDLNENDGGAITGFGGPVHGTPYAFKYRQVWKLNPTGDNLIPYLPRKLSDTYGSIAAKAVVNGRAHDGTPAIYFLSPDGPCRILIQGGAAAIQYLGRDVEDIWATVNLAATSVVGHAIYHTDKHQVWFWIATGSNNDPDTKLVFDVLLGKYVEGERVRGGWYKHTGNSAAARCSVMMSKTLAASMSRILGPYLGRASGTAIWAADTTATSDAGGTFQAYVKTRPLQVAPLGQNAGVGQSVLFATALSGVTITQTLDRDYGVETRTSTASLTPSATESKVIVKFEGSDMSGAGSIQVQLGDAAAAATGAWSLDALVIPALPQETR